VIRWLAICAALAACAPATRRAPARIIDMHAHAYPAERFDPRGEPDPVTGRPSAATDERKHQELSLAAMERHKIVRAVVSGRLQAVDRWRAASPARVIAGIGIGELTQMSPDELRAAVREGRVSVLGEPGLQ